MDQKENKIYLSTLSKPEEFPDLHSMQVKINELYAKILASQEEMSKTRLFNIKVNDYVIWKEDHHKEFYNKFDKILK